MMPLDIRSDATCVLSRLAVSSDATAPTLFIILTNSVDPPLQSIASVSITCRGILHVVFVINNSTQRAYSWRIFLVFRDSESGKRLRLLALTERVSFHKVK